MPKMPKLGNLSIGEIFSRTESIVNKKMGNLEKMYETYG